MKQELGDPDISGAAGVPSFAPAAFLKLCFRARSGFGFRTGFEAWPRKGHEEKADVRFSDLKLKPCPSGGSCANDRRGIRLRI